MSSGRRFWVLAQVCHVGQRYGTIRAGDPKHAVAEFNIGRVTLEMTACEQNTLLDDRAAAGVHGAADKLHRPRSAGPFSERQVIAVPLPDRDPAGRHAQFGGDNMRVSRRLALSTGLVADRDGHLAIRQHLDVGILAGRAAGVVDIGHDARAMQQTLVLCVCTPRLQ